MRKDYEALARSWRTVAKALEFNESLERFLMDRDRARIAKLPEPPVFPAIE
jgi:hypothetical protein